MKCFLILIFCTLLLWCSSAVAQTHSLFSGNCNPNNTVTLYEQTIVLKNPNPGSLYKQPPPARRWYDVFSRFSFRRRSTVHQLYNSGPILNATIIFPPNGTANNFVIRGIQVIDNKTNNTGGYATIIEGGVNHNFTKIILKSQPGGDLSNKVTIFTNKDDVHPKPAFGWAPQYQPPSANYNQIAGRYWPK